MELAIAEIMREKGVNMTQLAARLDTAPIQMSRLLKGERRMTVEWLRRIAGALGVTAGDLLTLQDNPHRMRADDRALLDAYRMIDPAVQPRVPAMLEALGGSSPTTSFEQGLLRRARELDDAGRDRLQRLIDAAA